jgi:hypothetical protein
MTTDQKKQEQHTRRSEQAKVEPKDTKAGKEQSEAARAIEETKQAQVQREAGSAKTAATPEDKLAPKLTPEEKKAQAQTKKDEHAAIEKVATINQRLAKDGSGNRVDAFIRHGEVCYRWGNFVPTREMTPDELDAVETL